MYYRVLRPFEADRPLARGDVVQAENWRNVNQLVSQRYLQPLAPHEARIASAVPATEAGENEDTNAESNHEGQGSARGSQPARRRA